MAIAIVTAVFLFLFCLSIFLLFVAFCFFVCLFGFWFLSEKQNLLQEPRFLLMSPWPELCRMATSTKGIWETSI